MRISGNTNNECQMVVKTVTISKTSEDESTWNIGHTTMLGITTGITAKIPLTGSRGVEFNGEKTLQFNRGTTMVAAHSHSVSVELKVPPNHSCTMYMEGRKITTDIPFTARLSRTYGNGETQYLWGVRCGSDRRDPGRGEPL
ncbi:natterin-3 [Salmo salar]|uniref:Natterin-3-like n=1 Tax=Salmo salar TaxID=8030 RepID=A0A1S3PHF7_SALSA|nr:natterin-3-like [Salmo salar]XP_045562688.1 natterin-3-like [Salmo salar]XP_045562689.1 natterin-3-like [Salmo salar]|eukprot:XP_014027036.1 PREDICTED: natterin-3-like [Salmo salar]